MNDGGVKNLDQIQEQDGSDRPSKAISIAFIGLGGACVVFAALALTGKKAPAVAPKADPLGALVANSKAPPGEIRKATDLSTHEVTFPKLLSDNENPTTALAAVKGGSPAPSSSAVVAMQPDPSLQAPPPATDRLPVVPVPARHVLEASPILTRPRDALTKAASESAQISTPGNPTAPQGREGGYQLQISSFRTQAEADQFATQLRARNHKAYVTEAHVPGRGTWYRVRIGPFASQHAAASYRSGFEGREHVVPFIIVPAGKETK